MAARAKAGSNAQRAADGVWVRARDAAPRSEGNDRFGQLLAEAGWIVGAVVAVALFAMLVSFSQNDPAFSHTASAAGVENIGGRFGAWVADIALLLFGLSAYLLVFGLAITVVRGFRKLHRVASGDPLNDDLPAYAHGIGFVLLLFGAVSLETLRFHTLGVALPGWPGGVVGNSVAQFLQASVGFTGATVIMLVAIAIGLSLFLDFSWLAVAERFGGFLEGFSRRSRRKREEAEDRAIGEAEAKVREAALSDERERKQKEKQVPLFAEMADARLPPLDLLDEPPPNLEAISTETLEFTSRLIEKKLRDFNVEAVVVAAYPGPVITRYEIEPAVGVKGSQIVNLAKDLARALSLVSIRVVETIPGKNLMGLELPNPRRQVVKLSEILGSAIYNESHSLLTLGLGKDISGKPVVLDLARMPHLMVAGTTGSGKSVGINAMILSILYKADPSQVRMILIDPKMLELSVYEGIPHLLAPVVTDMREAGIALQWCVTEMDKRYRLLSKLGVRSLTTYNQKIVDARAKGEFIANPFSLTPAEPEPLDTLPMIVVVIDELADLMMVSSKKVEELIARIAQKARASGMHLILATQRPSVDVITGLIKANIPARISYQVSSRVDSRTILDQMGSESLLGQGDMLYLAPGTGLPTRVHGAFVADAEVHRVVDVLKSRAAPQYVEGLLEPVEGNGESGEASANGGVYANEADPLYDQAVEIVLKNRRASISLVQRHLRIGYNRAARLLEDMERAGMVSAMQSNGNRDILVPARES